MRISWGAWLLGTCLIGCGTDYGHHGYSAAGGTSNAGGRTARGSGGRSSLGGAANDDPLAPVVTLTSPKAARDPDADPILVEDEVEATCTVAASTAQGAKPVDTTTVKLAVYDGSRTLLQETAGIRGANDGEYSAKFILADVPSGALSFTCSAADSDGRSSTARVDTFLDRGPEITIESPLPDSARSPQSAVKFQFSVAPDTLTAGDEGATVKAVTLQVNGVDMDLSEAEDPASKGSYSLDVDFNDTTVFKPRPTGHIPVVITATNARKPDGVVAKRTYQFTLDATGPDIEILSPIDQSVLGGQITLQFKATDPEPSSGVDPTTVVVKIGDTEKHRYSPDDGTWKKEDDGTYTFSFNSRVIPVTTVLLNVNILASDMAGNASIGAGAQYHLDNLPPVMDLDPANIREIRTVDAKDVCSDPFDPVGGEAANDLSVVPDVVTLRSVIFDRTNGADGLKVKFPAQVDPDSVQLFAQADTSKPLLIDTDGDKVCDDLDPDLRLSLPFQPLVPIEPQGEPPSNGVGAISNVCAAADTVDPPPPYLCGGTSDLSRVIQDTYVDSVVPAVYGIGQHAECLSSQWQLPPLLKRNGWVCLAVRATDRANNVGISRPIRVCLNSKSYPTPACATPSSTGPIPTCTDGCIPPPRYARNPPIIPRL